MIAHFLIWHGTFSLGPHSSGGWDELVHWSCFYKDPEFLKLPPVWPDCLSNASALNPSSFCRLGFQICGLEGGKQRHWDHGLEPEPLWIFFYKKQGMWRQRHIEWGTVRLGIDIHNVKGQRWPANHQLPEWQGLMFTHRLRGRWPCWHLNSVLDSKTKKKNHFVVWVCGSALCPEFPALPKEKRE